MEKYSNRSSLEQERMQRQRTRKMNKAKPTKKVMVMRNEERTNKPGRTRARKRKPKFGKGVIVILIIGIALVVMLYSPLLSINEISVDGNSIISKSHILKPLRNVVGMNALTANTGSIKDKFLLNYPSLADQILEDNSGIASAEVRYNLGGTLEVSVVEAKPAAVVVLDKSFAIVDSDWVILQKSSVNPFDGASDKFSSEIPSGEIQGSTSSSPLDASPIPSQNEKDAANRNSSAKPGVEATPKAGVKASAAPSAKTKKKAKDSGVSKADAENMSSNKAYGVDDKMFLVYGISEDQLRTDHLQIHTDSYQLELLDEAVKYVKDNEKIFKGKNRVFAIDISDNCTSLMLVRGIDVQLGDLLKSNSEEKLYVAQLMSGVLKELSASDKGVLDMYSGENPVFMPTRNENKQSKR